MVTDRNALSGLQGHLSFTRTTDPRLSVSNLVREQWVIWKREEYWVTSLTPSLSTSLNRFRYTEHSAGPKVGPDPLQSRTRVWAVVGDRSCPERKQAVKIETQNR